MRASMRGGAVYQHTVLVCAHCDVTAGEAGSPRSGRHDDARDRDRRRQRGPVDRDPVLRPVARGAVHHEGPGLPARDARRHPHRHGGLRVGALPPERALHAVARPVRGGRARPLGMAREPQRRARGAAARTRSTPADRRGDDHLAHDRACADGDLVLLLQQALAREPAVRELLAAPREWVTSLGEIAGFAARVMAGVFSGRVLRFFAEALRQAGILILGSALVIWGLAFILGLQCGIEGAYFSRSTGAPAYSGVFSAWCDLREVMPYAFGYMMSAKVGTGLVAEIGAMRISDEIDALEVMGIDSLLFLCATRLFAAWLVLPFIYIAAVGAGYLASYVAVVQQVGETSSGGFFLIFWMFQNPPDLFYSLIKGMAMATVIVLVGCYYGYNASGGPVGVGTATAKSMVLNTVMVHLVGMVGTQIFWGSNPRAPIGG